MRNKRGRSSSLSGLSGVYLGAALGFLALKGATLLLNAAVFPRLRPQPVPPGSPRVSILIPARDEAHNLPLTLPGVLAQGADEVLVLDDGSGDRTAQIARGLGARVIPGQPLPPGWFGKPWACQQLGEAARGEVLIFTDADVRWHPGALGAVLQELATRKADLLTVLPRPEELTPGARILTPLVDAVVLCLLPYPLLQTRWPLATTANGQLMAFRREAYEALGGHACVRAEMLEDTVFARRLKARGGRVRQALGQECVGVRMYGGYRESVAGFGKNAVGVHLNSRVLMVTLGLWHGAVYALPWLVPARSSAWWTLRLAGLLERALVNVVTGRRTPADLAEGLLGPLTPLFALPAYRLALRRRVTWKGREYAQ
ncbi:glycosyltransferase [Deinococcus apachensis]|uniref:glycosyltransferase n=1 Tax=Deinococcus apachensis TaxID=309886 RepID=UPI00036678A3|nr:glycosyltransferase [Deinococcus apachensis]